MSVALDTELNREVALKEIQAPHADHLDSRARFELEAEVTGGLEHPGIVPVYGMGHHLDGRPFYAMKFIKGSSLKEAIQRYHQPDEKATPETTGLLGLRSLLGRFLDVCEAMQYAHDRGILHRDLKPGNIMLGNYGETLVVDWGLAKVQGKAEPTTDERPLIPSHSASGSLEATLPGSAVGTPHYMSPEQAAGRLEDLGPASDVYSLGATLYHVLTNTAPFQQEEKDQDLGVLLQAVQQGNLKRPRTLKPHIPRALEAICLKAMSLKTADRYATPRELAKEIEHWLADEPVTAFTEPLTTRLARFGRRHRAWVQVSMAVVLLLVTLMIWSIFVRDPQLKALARMERIKHYGALQNQEISKHEADEQIRALQAITSVACSQDGLRIVTGSWDKTARLWDGRTGSPLGEPLRHEAAVTSVAFSPDSLRVITGSRDRTARLWDGRTGASLGEPLRHEEAVTGVAFSPDGLRVVTGSRDRTARLWDGRTGAPLGEPLRHDWPVDNVAFSSDGTRVLAIARGNVQLWDVSHRKLPAAQVEFGN